MSEASREVATWTMVVLSLVLAVALPVITPWYLMRPENFRRLWLFASPSRVIGGCAVALIGLTAWGAAMVALATIYWFMWATVALTVGVAVVVGIITVRYFTHDVSDLL